MLLPINEVVNLGLPGTCTWSTPRPRHETMLGQVVAYSSSPPCFNGNGYWSMIIHVQRPKDIRSEFIRVEFSLPCNETPGWASAKPSIQKFHLFRQKDCDAVLLEFIKIETKRGSSAIPMWARPPGADDELPFGQIVPCYYSVDLPLVPVL